MVNSMHEPQPIRSHAGGQMHSSCRLAAVSKSCGWKTFVCNYNPPGGLTGLCPCRTFNTCKSFRNSTAIICGPFPSWSCLQPTSQATWHSCTTTTVILRYRITGSSHIYLLLLEPSPTGCPSSYILAARALMCQPSCMLSSPSPVGGPNDQHLAPVCQPVHERQQHAHNAGKDLVRTTRPDRTHTQEVQEAMSPLANP